MRKYKLKTFVMKWRCLNNSFQTIWKKCQYNLISDFTLWKKVTFTKMLHSSSKKRKYSESCNDIFLYTHIYFCWWRHYSSLITLIQTGVSSIEKAFMQLDWKERSTLCNVLLWWRVYKIGRTSLSYANFCACTLLWIAFASNCAVILQIQAAELPQQFKKQDPRKFPVEFEAHPSMPCLLSAIFQW